MAVKYLLNHYDPKITDSIEYASKIQTALLPKQKFIDEIFPNYFIFYQPKDIDSGDFFWIYKFNEKIITAIADCTGHGVPGAFMSMLGITLLKEISSTNPYLKANEILNILREKIIDTLQQNKEGNDSSKDGMDIALTIYDFSKMQVEYAGAYNPLLLIRNNEIIEIKADRMPVGIYIKFNISFTNHIIDLRTNDMLYSFSDGFQDQFGGKNNSKFLLKNLKKLLLEICNKNLQSQKEILIDTFIE